MSATWTSDVTKVVRRQSKQLDNFLKVGGKGRALGPLERHILGRAPDDRRHDILHPSALCKDGWCPRAAYFTVTSPSRPKPKRIGRRTQSIFDEGHQAHAKYQKWYWEMGNLYGTWRCLVCHHSWWALSPEFCADLTCQSTLIEYAEVPLEVPEWLIAGHSDGWLKGLGDDLLLEVKTVGKGTVRMEAPAMFDRYEGDMDLIWRNLTRPFPSHLRQGQLYLRLLDHLQPGRITEIVYIYENKADQDAKEFVVKYNPALTEQLIERACSVRRAVDLGEAPECPRGGCDACKDLGKTDE